MNLSTWMSQTGQNIHSGSRVYLNFKHVELVCRTQPDSQLKVVFIFVPGYCIFFLLQNITHCTSQLFLSTLLWLMLVCMYFSESRTLLLWCPLMVHLTEWVILTWHMNFKILNWISIITRSRWLTQCPMTECWPVVSGHQCGPGPMCQLATACAHHQRHWPLWATGGVTSPGSPSLTRDTLEWAELSDHTCTPGALTEKAAHHKLVPIHRPGPPRPLSATGSLHKREDDVLMNTRNRPAEISQKMVESSNSK